MTEKITLSENQKKVLKYFQEEVQEGHIAFFERIAGGIEIEERLVRLACRALKRKGLMRYGVCVDYDERPMGSGYSLTSLGENFII